MLGYYSRGSLQRSAKPVAGNKGKRKTGKEKEEKREGMGKGEGNGWK